MYILQAWTNRSRMSTAGQNKFVRKKKLRLEGKHDQLLTMAKEQKELVVLVNPRALMADSMMQSCERQMWFRDVSNL